MTCKFFNLWERMCHLYKGFASCFKIVIFWSLIKAGSDFYNWCASYLASFHSSIWSFNWNSSWAHASIIDDPNSNYSSWHCIDKYACWCRERLSGHWIWIIQDVKKDNFPFKSTEFGRVTHPYKDWFCPWNPQIHGSHVSSDLVGQPPIPSTKTTYMFRSFLHPPLYCERYSRYKRRSFTIILNRLLT